jgi:hypothetical protein
VRQAPACVFSLVIASPNTTVPVETITLAMLCAQELTLVLQIEYLLG